MIADDFEERLLQEYRYNASQIEEHNAALRVLNPRQQKLADLIQAYGLEKRLDRLEDGDDPKGDAAAAKTKGEALTEAVSVVLRENGNQWVKLSDIYSDMLARGITVGGKNPNATLSAHLSNSKMFESDRVHGWRLKQKFIDEGYAKKPSDPKIVLQAKEISLNEAYKLSHKK